LLTKLVTGLDSTPTASMLDGNGVLHPFGFGLASHVGVSLDIPTLGVAKNLLCGNVENNTVFIDDKKKGYVFSQSKRVKKPIYVSPGHKISFKSSLRIVKHLSSYKIPEPLRQAHIISKKNI
jgi:deoxyribonuclease V